MERFKWQTSGNGIHLYKVIGEIIVKKLRVVQIGVCHDHGTSALNSILKQTDLFEVLGFAVTPEELENEKDLCEEIISEYRDKRGLKLYTVEEALHLKDVKAVTVETREEYLNKYAMMAAESGLHIYMDKPGGWGLSEFEKLVLAVKSRGLTLFIGYMYRFNPKVIEAIDKIKSGEIGDVYCVEAHMDCEHIAEKRQSLAKLPGGMMFFLGCHLIDLIYKIQGEPLDVIPLNCSTGYEGVTAKDYGMVVFKYPHGVSFAKTCANECGGFIRRQLVICGTKGTIEIKPFEVLTDERDCLYTEMRETYRNEGWNSFGKQTKSEYYNRFDAMLAAFADVAAGRKENPYSYDYELGLFKLLLKSCGE